jgi:nucleotide-binding universal stress UspA family protein
VLQQILLPTDGSELSELAVPVAEMIARAQGASITLARVVRYPSWMLDDQTEYITPENYEELVGSLDLGAQEDLNRIAAQVKDVPVKTEVLHGTPGAALLDLEEQLHPDLLVMASHGRTGLARFTMGSVADLMIREGAVPVMLVRSHEAVASKLENALVPLDGSTLAEQALPMVEALAGKPLRRVVLVQAISAPEDQTMATEYLESIASRLGPLGLEVTHRVDVDDPADAITHAAQGMDLIILSTHGRGGFDRVRHGSIAERATRHLPIPTLLVRASGGA